MRVARCISICSSVSKAILPLALYLAQLKSHFVSDSQRIFKTSDYCGMRIRANVLIFGTANSPSGRFSSFPELVGERPFFAHSGRRLESTPAAAPSRAWAPTLRRSEVRIPSAPPGSPQARRAATSHCVGLRNFRAKLSASPIASYFALS
jgi:hypothetical protein